MFTSSPAAEAAVRALIFFSVSFELYFFGMSSDEETHASDSTSADGFSFESWATSHKLSRKTCQTLRKEELVVSDALCCLTPDDVNILCLPLGQAKLLNLAVKKLLASAAEASASAAQSTRPAEPRESSAPRPSEAEADNVTINDIRQQAATLDAAGQFLDSLPSTLLPTPTLPAPVAGMTRDRPQVIPVNNNPDPRVVLTLQASGKKATHITNFLSDKARSRLRKSRKNYVLAESATADDGHMVIRTDSDTHPYMGVSIEEWGAANARLTHHLTKTGALSTGDLDYYLAYTAIIFEFADRYDWNSVLEFDYRYREQQAEHDFQWGYVNPMMELQILRPKLRQQPQPSFLKTPSAPKEECRQWKRNNGYCPFGDKCRYTHPHLPPRPDSQCQPPKK